MIQLIALALVALNIYLPVNAWITHEAGTATPLAYIGLGFCLYFWLLVLIHFCTPKERRKMYSQLDLENVLITYQLENSKETKH